MTYSFIKQSKTVPLEKMLRVIEEYGIERDMLEKSHPTSREILQLYQMIKENKNLRRVNETVKHLREYVEKLGNRNHNISNYPELFLR